MGPYSSYATGEVIFPDPGELNFCWVTDFPFVMWNADEDRWDPSHHLFTAPMDEDIPLLDTDPGQARGKQYDLVCNGYEIAGAASGFTGVTSRRRSSISSG